MAGDGVLSPGIRVSAREAAPASRARRVAGQAGPMEFAEVIARRRMVRRFDPDRPVPEEALRRILGAALRAPSAGFSQGRDLLVLRTPRDRDAFWAATAGEREGPPDPWMRGVGAAPVVVLVLSDPGAYLERYSRPDKARSGLGPDPGAWPVPWWDVDAGMSALLALLAAVDEELGALLFGVPADRHEAVRATFDVPADRRLVGAVALGTPAAGPPTGRRSPHRPRRRRVEEAVHDGRFGTAWAPRPDEAGTGCA